MSEEVLASITGAIPDLIKSIVALFIVVDPLGNVPVFVGLTEKMREDERRRAFKTATITGFFLLLCFAIAGQQILNLFGITIHSFMIAGGILLLLIAIRLLLNEGRQKQSVAPESVGAVPIACPLLVGPGAITTTIVGLQTMGVVITVASIVSIFAVVWLTLKFIGPIYRFLGKTGSLVIARVMAMFIAAIAIQYIFGGLKHVLSL